MVLALKALLVGAGGGVQLHEGVALLHPVAVANKDGLDHAGLQGLDDLGAVALDDLALGDRNDIDLADGSPEQGDGKHADDGERHGAAHGGGWGFLDFQHGGEECQFLALGHGEGFFAVGGGPGDLPGGEVVVQAGAQGLGPGGGACYIRKGGNTLNH